MEQAISFLKRFRFDDSEIQSIFNICDMIQHTKVDEMVDNCNLLVKFGFPKTELDFLIKSNPQFLVLDAKSLERNLKDLVKNGEDLEELLLSNPYLI